ncbi:MAG: hypothetical protein ACFE8O_01670 [Candidatus Hermodarchaeota archaeon]
MKTYRQPFVIGLIFVFLIGMSGTAFISTQPRVAAYVPSVGNSTDYDYGFVSIQPNLTETQIYHWTGLNISVGNYTLQWQQYVNLTISVVNIAQVGPVLEAFYNFSVSIFGNVATVSNTSWQTIESLDGSMSAPAPTGVTDGLFAYPITDGVSGFFLDVATLATLTIGTDVIVGNGRWQEIDYTTIAFQGSDQLCYQLFNSTSTPEELQETTFVIDHDVGIYYQVNDTRILTVDSIQQSLTYYYEVLTTNIPLEPIPSPLPILIIIGVAVIVLVIIVFFLIRKLWLRRSQE